MRRLSVFLGRVLFVLALAFFRWAFVLAGKPLPSSPKRLKASPSDRFKALVNRGEWKV